MQGLAFYKKTQITNYFRVPAKVILIRAGEGGFKIVGSNGKIAKSNIVGWLLSVVKFQFQFSNLISYSRML